MAKEAKGGDKPGEASQSLQAPQFPEDRHGPNYDNDAQGWLRGIGTKPGFDKQKGRK